MSATRKIRTTHNFITRPASQNDWCAHWDGDEPNDGGGMATGWGKTEAEAIADLIENYGDENDAPAIAIETA